MSEEVILAPEIAVVEIPALSLLQMAKEYPKQLSTSVLVYKDLGFVRESGQVALYQVSVGAKSPPGNWERATAREAIWLNLNHYQQGQTWLFDGDIRTSSEIISSFNYLRTHPLMVVIKQQVGLMEFRSDYDLHIAPTTMSIWLKKVTTRKT
jgi:hypothetical protein